MMIKSKIAYLALIVCLFNLFSCAVQNKRSSEIKLKQTFPNTIIFNCVELPGYHDCSSNLVYIKMDEFEYLLDTIDESKLILKEDFSNQQVPDSAESACGGWCAGLGEYFYCIKDGNDVIVYKGWMDESQEDEGYHYQEFKRFTFID